MTVSSHQGTLQLNLAWAEPVTAPSLAQALMQDIQLGMQTLLSTTTTPQTEMV
jgi:hypothetical protein